VSPKDRSREERPAADVRISITRSSTHPVEYAVVLLARREGRWHTVRVFDNAHDPEEHHEHRYVGEEKVACRESWADIVREWESTR
jgi:hypothetical protein